MNISNKKAFTIIELIVVIAIIGILVLFGIPKLIGYVEKAQLTKIMHDTKVMEAMMEDELVRNSNVNYQKFIDNGKDLGLLIETNRLFETEGHAKNLQYVPMKGEIDGLSKHFSAQINDEGDHEKLGMGGPVIQEDENEFKEIYERYKIIPEEYKVKAGSKLKGTFYSNENGKVYYEIDKPIGIKNESKGLNCSTPLPDYTFEHEIGKIVKYNGNAEHLVIPSHFLVNGECWPVRIIGKGAFMQGNYKSIIIPDTVIIIEDDAFKDLEFDEIYIPGSVDKVGKGAFDGNYNVIYGGSSGRINQGSSGGSYTKPDGGIGSITYRPPTPGEAGVVFNPSTGTIVKGGGNSSIGGGYIPPYITVGNKEYPVKKIAKGAYQGLGLITVILPETLEVIEDYAFSGNQLIGIRIPHSVYHIGHYAFSFNEVWKVGNISGPERKATMKSMIIKDEEQFNKIDKLGNIMENDVKTDYLKGSEEKGPDVKLLDHIWVTSIGNVVIDVEYTPDKCWLNQKGDIIFCGLSPEAFDGDLDTHHVGGGRLVTWKGNLSGKKVFIKKTSGYYGIHNYNMYIRDSSGRNINFINLDTGKMISNIPTTIATMNISVPDNAFEFYFEGGSVYEIQVNNTITPKSVTNITSISNHTDITLNWEQSEPNYEKALIYRDGVFVSIVDGHSYKDSPLYADTEYKYEIYAMNKYGNSNFNKIIHSAKTTKPGIIFKGLDPGAFDGDLSTSVNAGIVTWEGDLSGKKVFIKKSSFEYEHIQNYNMYIRDSSGKNLDFINLDTGKVVNSIPTTTATMNISVPDNAVEFYFAGGSVYEVQVNTNISIPKSVSNITSISNHTDITLNWEQNESDYEKALIYRNGVFVSIAYGHSYKDSPLYTDTEYKYEIYAMNKYNNSNFNKTTHSAKTTRPEIVFKGLGPEAFDGDLSTSTNSGVVTWEGVLSGKKVFIKKSNGYNGVHNYNMYIRDSSGKNLDFVNLDTGKVVNSIPTTIATMNISVPDNAVEFYFAGGYVYEVQVNTNTSIPKSVSNITSISNHTNITLNWEQNEPDYEKSLIYRNGVFVAIANGHSYKDSPLYADTEYNYEIYAMSKYDNSNFSKITHSAKTTRPEIVFKGLGPEAFDGDLLTGTNPGIVTWEGVLSGKKVFIKKSSGYNGIHNYNMYIRDSLGKNLDFINLDTGKVVNNIPTTLTTMNISVPDNAVEFYFTGGQVYEVQIVD